MKVEYDIKAITEEIKSWLDEVFPERTLKSTHSKLEEEIAEWMKLPTDSAEIADIFICLLDLCDLYGIDPAKAIRHKMKVNRERRWTMKPNGTIQHE